MTTTTTSFHRFAELPFELREQIWQSALRPSEPGAHYFQIYSDFRDEDLITLEELELNLVAHRDFPLDHQLAKPLRRYFLPTLDKSQEEKDISTYLIDGGLWTACKESREIMETHYQTDKWRKMPKLCRQGISKDLLKLTATGYFVNNASPHYFTILPNYDLLVLQPLNYHTIEWGTFCYDVPFGTINNLGLEFDPEWGSQVLNGDSSDPESIPILATLIILAFSDCPLNKLWILDKDLKRRKDRPTSSTEFYTMDRRFIELDCDGSDCTLDDWEYVQKDVQGFSQNDCLSEHDQVSKDKPEISKDSSVYFVQMLRQALEDLDVTDDGSFDGEGWPCEVGLLGWDDLKS